ncbi:hypothetical protein [Acinetobacter sp. ANC 4173]|jgi:hypothetical protein|uniref:hypothetical protein n=1 Tax=Acinetobacter sp. ANC 4173 TaxID=2529837 RepID=UPI00103937E5|nr:hypothetical protein [Acinetobacter sp. ANC 4173]TCB79070.1 hypothetical protein E0H94_10520 [Acinetobacter sp. ANC 4173]
MAREMYDELYEEISKVFDKITPSGKVSKVRSRNIYFFLLRTIGDGIEKSKKLERINNFKKYIRDLEKCGITEEFIKEEHKKQPPRIENTQVTYVELVFDLNDQVPEGYEPPKSKYNMKEILGNANGKEQNIIKFQNK